MIEFGSSCCNFGVDGALGKGSLEIDGMKILTQSVCLRSPFTFIYTQPPGYVKSDNREETSPCMLPNHGYCWEDCVSSGVLWHARASLKLKHTVTDLTESQYSKCGVAIPVLHGQSTFSFLLRVWALNVLSNAVATDRCVFIWLYYFLNCVCVCLAASGPRLQPWGSLPGRVRRLLSSCGTDSECVDSVVVMHGLNCRRCVGS